MKKLLLIALALLAAYFTLNSKQSIFGGRKVQSHHAPVIPHRLIPPIKGIRLNDSGRR